MKSLKHLMAIIVLPLLLTSILLMAVDKPTYSLTTTTQTNLDNSRFTTNVMTPTWGSAPIDTAKSFTMNNSSLAVDSNDNLHIAYGGDQLYYAVKNGGGWQLETVDYATSVGSQQSIAIDANNYPHISYYDSVNKALKYARFDGTKWQIEVVETAGNANFAYSSIDIDSSARPHISYLDTTNKLLKYAQFNGTTWQITTIDTNIWGNGRTSLQVDSVDKIHISYSISINNNDSARYAYWNGSQWATQTIQSGSSVGQYTSLALDSSNHPHITYQDGSAETLVYTHWTGSIWQSEVIANITWAFNNSSIQMDNTDHPHVSYNNTNTGSAYYTTWTGSQWQTETIFDAERAFTTALALTSSNLPQVILVGSTTQDLFYVHKVANAWITETVDQGSNLGSYASLAIAPTAPYTAHVSYRGDGLKYAHFDGTTWQVESLDTVEIFGGTAVAIEPLPPHNPHIVYYDNTNDRIQHMYWTGSSWQMKTVDSPGISSGGGIDLSFDPNSPYNLHVIYSSGNKIKHGLWDGITWTTDTIATGGTEWWEGIGSGSIAIDSTGKPHISYHGAVYDGNLKYATWSGIAWDIETVEYTGNSSIKTAIALDNTNTPHIAYSDPYDDEIMYAYKDVSDWVIQVVDSHQGDVTSLVMDQAGNPHMSYWQSDNGYLMYAFDNGSSWQLESVNDFAYEGALALDRNNLPLIAYRSKTNDLRFAWKETQNTIPASGADFSIYGLVDFSFPANTFTDSVEISYTALEQFGVENNIGIYYDLSAVYTGSGLPAQPIPGESYTITLHYDQANVPTNVEESNLALYYREDDEWLAEPTSVVDVDANTITATPDHFSQWAALFSSDKKYVYLPMIVRD